MAIQGVAGEREAIDSARASGEAKRMFRKGKDRKDGFRTNPED